MIWMYSWWPSWLRSKSQRAFGLAESAAVATAMLSTVGSPSPTGAASTPISCDNPSYRRLRSLTAAAQWRFSAPAKMGPMPRRSIWAFTAHTASTRPWEEAGSSLNYDRYSGPDPGLQRCACERDRRVSRENRPHIGLQLRHLRHPLPRPRQSPWAAAYPSGSAGGTTPAD